MEFDNLCSPAILYVGFSLTHIVIDTGREEYSSAMVKFFIMIIFTLVLDMLCKRGLGTVSWILVLLPFISMTLITSILLSMFGVNEYSSTATYGGNPKQNKPTLPPGHPEASYNDVPYDPDDYTSGTPAEINHYNEPDSVNLTKEGVAAAEANE